MGSGRELILIALGLLAACGTDNGGPVIDTGLRPRDTGGLLDASDTGVEPEAGEMDTGLAPCSVQPNLTSIYANVLTARTCNQSGCHGGTSGGFGGLSFGKSKSAVRTDLLNVATSGGAAFPRYVVPGDVAQSYFVRKIDGSAGVVGSRMPLGAPALEACVIEAIRTWIIAGALDN